MSSVRDFHDLLSTAFKDYDSRVGTFGHALIKIAETVNGEFRPVIQDASPHAGQLLIIAKNQQRYVNDTVVTITYYEAVVDSVRTLDYLSYTYDVTLYKAGSEQTATVTLEAGEYGGTSHLLDVNATGVVDISFDDPFQDVEVYLLGDVGIRTLYGFNTDRWRKLITEAFHSLFVHPPLCQRCNGTGIDSLAFGTVCPDCGGYGYVGWYASGSMLTVRGNDVGVKRLGMDDEEYSMRAWSAKQFIFPAKEKIREHIAYLLGVDVEDITITEHSGKEYYYEVEYPNAPNSRIDPYGIGIVETIERLRPVGISAIPIIYFYLVSSGAFIEWFPAYTGDEHPVLGSGHTKLTNDSLNIPIPSFEYSPFYGGWYGGEFPSYEIHLARYSNIDGGNYDIQQGNYYYESGSAANIVTRPDPIFISGMQVSPGDPALSGFFSGLASDYEYETKIILNSAWYEVI